VSVAVAVGVFALRPGTGNTWGFHEFRLATSDIPV